MRETTYTTEQLCVIEHDGGHAVVAAVAGSGKTETLVGRVRHLLKSHEPHQIAVVMFNRDARESFQKRFGKAVAGRAPEIRTFNSMGNKIVGRLVLLGHLPPAEIVEKEYRRAAIARDVLTGLFRKIEGEGAAPDKELIDAFLGFVALVKGNIRSAEELFAAGDYGLSAKIFPEAYHLYEKERVRRKIRFFEDQIYDPVRLMLREPHIQEIFANKIDHLIVDEAQDVNAIQIALLRILAGKRAKVMLVGDEDQAIYEWRGARPDYLTRGFEADFKGAVRYTLPHTFRFGHALSLAASQLITRNKNRNPKISISADVTPQTRIHCLSLPLGLTGLGDHLRKLISTGVDPGDIAILVRNYSMTVGFELELHHYKIPHYIHGRAPLGKTQEITAMVGVLQLACGRWHDLGPEEVRTAIKSLLQRPALYLDKATTDALIERVIDQPTRISDAIRSAITPRMKDYQVEQIKDRADLLEIIALTTRPDESVATVLDRYLNGTKFVRSIEKQAATADQAQTILANVDAFRRIAGEHTGSIAAFLDEIDPLIDARPTKPPDEPQVWIGSIHRAKGAQWPHVFVPGLAARVFPREVVDEREMESERRLCYVAATRAVDALYLAHPACPDFRAAERSAAAPERMGASPVSPFLWEMDLALARHAASALESGSFTAVGVPRAQVVHDYFARFSASSEWRYTRRERAKPVLGEMRSVEAPTGTRFMPGVRVKHHSFGIGTVEQWIDQRVVRVIFDDEGSRLLVADRAGLALANEALHPSTATGKRTG